MRVATNLVTLITTHETTNRRDEAQLAVIMMY